MMKFYQEITLLPGAEISAGFLWQKLYQPLHMLMVESKHQSAENWVSVSFPQYSEKSLGHKLRVFARSENVLNNWQLKKVFRKFEDYMHITNIRSVPEQAGLVIFKRYQSSQGSLSHAKRAAKRHDMDVDEAYQLLNQKETKKLPFIQLKSLSTNQNVMRIKIQRQRVEENKECQLVFNAYGLKNPVPDFP